MNIIYTLWPKQYFTPQKRGDILLGDIKRTLLVQPIIALRMNIDDQDSQVKSPAPKWYDGDELVATVAITYADDSSASKQLASNNKKLLEEAGFVVGQYQVDTSIYKDYGDNEHFRKRDWSDGERSPEVVMAITLLTRPKKYAHSEWIRRWHGNMSPKSEVLQPRARYVRNVILNKTEDSPDFDGLVEEAWPSAEHINNPYLFYCSSNPLQLVWHIIRMLMAVTHFHKLKAIRTVTMSEYLLKTPQ